MPKSQKNTRPYNRTQKRDSKRTKKVMRKATTTLGKGSFAGVGPGRMHNSSGVAAQALREVARKSDKVAARKLAAKRKRKGK